MMRDTDYVYVPDNGDFSCDDMKAWRAYRGFTQEDVAILLDVHPQTVTHWERFIETPQHVQDKLKTIENAERPNRQKRRLGRPKKLRIKPPKPKPQPLSDEDAVLLEQVHSDWR